MMTCQQPMSPFPSSLSTSAIRASTVLSGTTWRRNLSRLSEKWKSTGTKSCPTSGTVAAAAAEKLIRRPKATIQTEDLTASQFAYMTGIKIKRGRNHQDTEQQQYVTYDDDSDDDDNYDDSTESKLSNNGNGNDDVNDMFPLTLDDQQLRQLTTKTTKTHHGSIPCITSHSTARYHSIWDARFWKQQQQEQGGLDTSHSGHDQDDKLVTLSSPVGPMVSSASGQYFGFSPNDSLSATDTCLYNSVSSSSLSSASSTSSTIFSTKLRVFHKGRFQIVLGGDNTTTKQPWEPMVRTTSLESRGNVVEWHRKRTLTQ